MFLINIEKNRIKAYLLYHLTPYLVEFNVIFFLKCEVSVYLRGCIHKGVKHYFSNSLHVCSCFDSSQDLANDEVGCFLFSVVVILGGLGVLSDGCSDSLLQLLLAHHGESPLLDESSRGLSGADVILHQLLGEAFRDGSIVNEFK